MVHSGSCGGKKWQVIIKEKCGSNKYTLFDSGEVFNEKMLRPMRALEVTIDFLVEQNTFNFEGFGVKVFDRMLKRPLWFTKKEK
jgi:hypothetical protein